MRFKLIQYHSGFGISKDDVFGIEYYRVRIFYSIDLKMIMTLCIQFELTVIYFSTNTLKAFTNMHTLYSLYIIDENAALN